MPHNYLSLGVVAIVSLVALYSGGKAYLGWHEDRANMRALSQQAEDLGVRDFIAEACQNRFDDMSARGKSLCMGR